MKLPNDVSRCAGRDFSGTSFETDHICEERNTCARYIALVKTDKENGIDGYTHPYIPVTTMMCENQNYTQKIEAKND